VSEALQTIDTPRTPFSVRRAFQGEHSSWHLWSLGWLGLLAVPLTHLDATAIGATLLSVVVFVPIYLFFYDEKHLKLWIARVAIFSIGGVLFIFNPFAHTYFLYACFPGDRASIRESVILMVVMLLASCAFFAVRGIDPAYDVLMAVLVLGVGGAVLLGRIQRQNRDVIHAKDREILHLARIAERERIARDLHDVLGHTLSLVVLKADLAARLIDVDPVRARLELGDLRDAARKSLADVRRTVGGMHQVSWQEGLQTACGLLDAAGIKTTISALPAEHLPESLQSALAHVVIEASTNITRHSSARHVLIALSDSDSALTLSVEDDGAGKIATEGHGLAGLRTRIEAAGGEFKVLQGGAGLRLVAVLPSPQRILNKDKV
jgi:two-component system sensor histidine kinase DesK